MADVPDIGEAFLLLLQKGFGQLPIIAFLYPVEDDHTVERRSRRPLLQSNGDCQLLNQCFDFFIFFSFTFCGPAVFLDLLIQFRVRINGQHIWTDKKWVQLIDDLAVALAPATPFPFPEIPVR